MRAILIDPFNREISEVEFNGDFHEIYKLIDCDTFTVATINHRQDGIFIDDDGLFKPDQAFFWHRGYPQPLAGKGLILGCDKFGESVEPTTTLDEVKAATQFLNHAQLTAIMLGVAI